MDEKDMRAFLALYEKRSLRQAAHDLFITPQGLRRILQRLEYEFGCPLFYRTKQGLISTQAGDYLYTEVEELTRQYSKIRHNMDNISKHKKEITIVCSYGAMPSLPYEHFVDFRKKYDHELSIRWREFPDKMALTAILNHEYSMGLIVTKAEEVKGDFVAKELYSESMVVLVYEGHPFYERDSIKIEELKAEDLIMEGDDFWIYHYFQNKCLQRGFAPNIVIETGDIAFCHKLCSIKQGLGISVGFISEFINADGVKAIPIEGEEQAWPVCLIYHKKNVFSESDRMLLEFLSEIEKIHETK